MLETIQEIFENFVEWGTHPLILPYVVSILIFIAGAIALWFKTQWATIPHELGHAIVAILLGKKLTAININQDSSGDTRTTEFKPRNGLLSFITAPFRWIRGILVSFAGYPAPFALSLLMTWLWGQDMAKIALLVVFVLLAFTLIHSRNLFGFLMIILGMAITGVIIWLATYPIIHEITVLALAGGMASGGVAGVIEAWKVYNQDRRTSNERWDDPGFEPQHSDARQLSRVTLLPQVVWLSIFSLVGAAGLLWTLIELASAYT